MKSNLRLVLTGSAVLIAIVAITALLFRAATNIAQPFPTIPPVSSADSRDVSKRIMHIGVVSRYPPPVLYQEYQPIMDYLTKRTPYRFELKLGTSYQETVEQLVRGEVDAAFLGTYIYVRARDQYGVRAILKPLNENGEPFSRSVLITQTISPIRSVADLRGKRIALPSQDSFSGNWLPLHEFAREGSRPEDVPTVRHFAHHQSVVYQVLNGKFDAGVVKERVARQFLHRNIRIVLSSDPIPGSPLVVRRDCDTAFVRALRSALLHVDLHDEREQVENWDQEFRFGFVEATDADYEGIRRLFQRSEGTAR
jgi:phosphonate transport system substrate-binding protein